MNRVGWLVLLIALFGAVSALMSHGGYGWTLFIVMPVLAGWVGVKIFPCSSADLARGTGAGIGVAGTLLLVALRMEGAICVVMVLPLVALLGALGGWMAYNTTGPSGDVNNFV